MWVTIGFWGQIVPRPYLWEQIKRVGFVCKLPIVLNHLSQMPHIDQHQHAPGIFYTPDVTNT